MPCPSSRAFPPMPWPTHKSPCMRARRAVWMHSASTRVRDPRKKGGAMPSARGYWPWSVSLVGSLAPTCTQAESGGSSVHRTSRGAHMPVPAPTMDGATLQPQEPASAGALSSRPWPALDRECAKHAPTCSKPVSSDVQVMCTWLRRFTPTRLSWGKGRVAGPKGCLRALGAVASGRWRYGIRDTSVASGCDATGHMQSAPGEELRRQ